MDMGTLPLLAAALTVGVAATSAIASAETIPTADLAVVSTNADVSHAKVGDQVTFTIVATNNGPDAAELDVTENLSSGLALAGDRCDRGISADGTFCEYGTIQPGETLTTVVLAAVVSKDDKYATNTTCVRSEQVINDTDTSNDCASAGVKTFGRPN
jgi:uncharacterized repeat protein (TIGR01451 family)